MKIDVRYHCFACNADGDAINFVTQLYGLRPVEAAKRIATDFGIGYDYSARDPPPAEAEPTISPEQEFKQAVDYCYYTLCRYLHQLEDWKTEYAPQPEDADWHPLFCEALSKITIVEYYLDILMDGTDDEINLLSKLCCFQAIPRDQIPE